MRRQRVLKIHHIEGEEKGGNSIIFHAVNTFFSILGPLITVFSVLRVISVDAWGALALGQAIGLFSSIFVSLGTTVNGPNEIANSKKSKQVEVLLKISFIQIVALIPASALSFLIAFLFSNSNKVLAGLGSVSLNFSALTIAWYFFGKGEPKKLLIFETLPRFIITMLSLVIFFNTENIYNQIFIQIIFTFLLFVITLFVIFKQSTIDWHLLNIGISLNIQYSQRIKSTTIALISCLNSVTPILILSLTANAAVPTWAAIDKIARYFSIVNEPLTNRYRNLSNTQQINDFKSFFSWRVFVQHFVSGAILSLCLFISGPRVLSVISSNRIILDHQSFLFISISLFINLSTRSPAFLLLSSKNNLSGILRSLSFTFILSIPILYILTRSYSFSGACFSVFIVSLLTALFHLSAMKSRFIKNC